MIFTEIYKSLAPIVLSWNNVAIFKKLTASKQNSTKQNETKQYHVFYMYFSIAPSRMHCPRIHMFHFFAIHWLLP